MSGFVSVLDAHQGPQPVQHLEPVLFLSALCGRGDAWFEPVVMWVKEPFILTDWPCAESACKTSGEPGDLFVSFCKHAVDCFEESYSASWRSVLVFFKLPEWLFSREK